MRIPGRVVPPPLFWVSGGVRDWIASPGCSRRTVMPPLRGGRLFYSCLLFPGLAPRATDLSPLRGLKMGRSCYGLWFTCYVLRVTGYGLRVTGYGLRVAGCGLRVTGCGLRVAGYGLRVTGCGLRVAGYGLRVTGYDEEVAMWGGYGFGVQPRRGYMSVARGGSEL